MDIKLPAGRYVLGVSGGVDSMVLLDLLAKKTGVSLVVAHFNHGIRGDSAKDEQLVKQAAKKYGVVFEAGRAELGKNSSEAAARQARYGFLEAVRAKHSAGAVITAHHQDDLIETAFINIIRGTARQGLSSIASNPNVLRPMLGVPKKLIIEYALENNLHWREDSTNANNTYLRNNLRNNLLVKLTDEQRIDLAKKLDKVAKLNLKIDNELATLSQTRDEMTINRTAFTDLPVGVGNELIAYLLRRAQVNDYDTKTVNRLNMAIRTSIANSNHAIKGDFTLKVSTKTATIVTP